MYGDTPTGAPLYKLYGASQDEMKKFGLMYSLLSPAAIHRIVRKCGNADDRDPLPLSCSTVKYYDAEMGFWTYRIETSFSFSPPADVEDGDTKRCTFSGGRRGNVTGRKLRTS